MRARAPQSSHQFGSGASGPAAAWCVHGRADAALSDGGTRAGGPTSMPLMR